MSVTDLRDLIRLIEQHPEWRAELRRVVLGDELLALPEVMRELAGEVRELAAAQRRTEERLEELAAAQRSTDERLSALTEEVRRLAEKVSQLAEEVRQLAVGLRELTGRVGQMQGEIGVMRGDLLELRYARHVGGYLGRLLRRARLLDADRLDDLLDSALEAGTLTDEDAEDIRLSDVIVQGRRKATGAEATIVVEVSGEIEDYDVSRAARRAALLSRVLTAEATQAAVAGHWITPAAVAAAADSGVRVLLHSRRGGEPVEQ